MTPAEIGANSDGFTTTVFPAATGDMTARQDRTLAPFHGVKLATTPSGRRHGRAPIRASSCCDAGKQLSAIGLVDLEDLIINGVAPLVTGKIAILLHGLLRGLHCCGLHYC